MALPPDLLHRSPEEAVRRIALSFIDEAHAASLRLDDPDDAEALHDFRVGIRRLRSCVGTWRDRLKGTIGKRDRRALKALQNATGGGRDAEVAIEWLGTLRSDLRPVHRRGHTWMIQRLEARHGAAMEHACEQVRDDFRLVEGDLRSRLGRMKVEIDLDGASGGSTYAEALAEKTREQAKALVLHLSHVTSLRDEEEAHEARIMGKRMRYLLEPVREIVPEAQDLVKRMKKLQDILGELNDAHVLDAALRVALEEAAVANVRELTALLAEADEEALKRFNRQNERSGLIELVRRNQQRAQKLFARLQKDWLEGGAAELLGRVEVLARALEKRARIGTEIERKYLLKALPELPDGVEPIEIDQGWLPGKALQERLRRTSKGGKEAFFRTVKLGSGLTRTELEEKASKALFEALWPFTEGKRVSKRRYKIPDGDVVWEIDEFVDRTLFLAEVELESADQEAPVPEWLQPVLTRQVTGDSRYVNINLAR